MDVAARKRTGLFACAGLATLALAAAAPAAAKDVTLTGQAANGAPVDLIVSDLGNATEFNIGGTKIICKRGGKLKTGTTTFRRFKVSDPGFFRAKGKSSNRDNGVKLKSKFSATGSSADGLTWDGRFKETTKVFDGRKKIDTCKLRTSWTAS
jgi:hypothetical protein